MGLFAKPLGQSQPSTTASTLYTKAQSAVVYLDSLYICNTTGSAATYRVFLDADGSTYTTATALWYDVSLGANTTVVYDLKAYLLAEGGSVGVRAGTNTALTFTLFGEEVFQ